MPWYKDRDFPEVKASNSDVVAVIGSPKELQRVIDDYNKLEAERDELYDLVRDVARATTMDESWEQSERCADYLDRITGHWNGVNK